jgi:hypothetical protein
MVSVDVARLDLKPANRSDNLNGLVLSGREPKVNPVVRAGEIASPDPNGGQIRAEVAVEIRDRKRQSRLNGIDRRPLDICACRYAPDGKSKKQQ